MWTHFVHFVHISVGTNTTKYFTSSFGGVDCTSALSNHLIHPLFATKFMLGIRLFQLMMWQQLLHVASNKNRVISSSLA
jgi:hypothetical protein